MADRHARRGAVDDASAPFFQWTQPLDVQATHAPPPRSGHAMTLLPATASVLVFGGSNGHEFFDDFHVLEPTQYAAEKTPRKSAAKDRLLPARLDGKRDHSDDAAQRLSLVWKKLVVSRAPSTALYTNPSFLSSSFGSSSDSPPRGLLAEEDVHLGGGRDYHSMHYVPTSADEEKRLGFRVLVVGNPIVCPAVEDDDDSVRSADSVRTFDMDEMRVDEVRVKQPLLEAQWVPRKIRSMYKPHARSGHCSALLGEQLFCFGGKDATLTAYYNDFFYFDVALNQWREPATTGSTPSPRAFAAMTVSASTEQLFLFGGNDSKQQFGGMYMYDVRLSRWDKVVTKGDKPGTYINHSLTFVGPQYLVLFGGRQRASRRNDSFLYDVQSRVWKQLGGKTARTGKRTRSDTSSVAGSQSQSQQIMGASQANVALSGAPCPQKRTAHSAVHYQQSTSSHSGVHRILVFGGYVGSHTWLNDSHVLEFDAKKISQPPEFVSQVPQAFSTSSTSSIEIVTTRGPSTASNLSGSSQSNASGSSQSNPRSSSRSSNEFALTDITNIAPPVHDDTAAFSTSTESTAVAASTGAARASYTPAAVAARRRKLAEMESSRVETSTSSQKKRRRVTPSERTGLSQSQSQTENSEAPSMVVPTSKSRAGSPSGSDTIGLQTTMIQVLQQQQRMESTLTRISSAMREDHGSRQQDAIASHQIFLQKQNEQLEKKLESMTRRYETVCAKAQALEEDNGRLKQKLVAAETEIYLSNKTIDQIVPGIGSKVLDAVEAVSRAQATSTQLIEAKISSIHDLVDEIRHASGERTETDDSPQKRDSIFADDCTPSQPTVLYPQTVVRGLENQLHDAVQENQGLRKHIDSLESRLKKAERNAQQIQELSRAWLRSPDSQDEEETKGV